ncbi:hypothetical protein E2C01_036498 [Portunus trituberculatus]|uniref:Uncharacterized protein n=1 Tax=Portunus trituberculatus TaxID=210409 RepID=A0A5B7FBC4_PORTR|nr:hypothetical protein [Portunus trituberculatus]
MSTEGVGGFYNINADDYFIRIVNIWNFLPSIVIDCERITAIKNRLRNYLDSNPQLRCYPMS